MRSDISGNLISGPIPNSFLSLNLASCSLDTSLFCLTFTFTICGDSIPPCPPPSASSSLVLLPAVLVGLNDLAVKVPEAFENVSSTDSLTLIELASLNLTLDEMGNIQIVHSSENEVKKLKPVSPQSLAPRVQLPSFDKVIQFGSAPRNSLSFLTFMIGVAYVETFRMVALAIKLFNEIRGSVMKFVVILAMFIHFCNTALYTLILIYQSSGLNVSNKTIALWGLLGTCFLFLSKVCVLCMTFDRLLKFNRVTRNLKLVA
jgi:hypothetical protein